MKISWLSPLSCLFVIMPENKQKQEERGEAGKWLSSRDMGGHCYMSQRLLSQAPAFRITILTSSHSSDNEWWTGELALHNTTWSQVRALHGRIIAICVVDQRLVLFSLWRSPPGTSSRWSSSWGRCRWWWAPTLEPTPGSTVSSASREWVTEDVSMTRYPGILSAQTNAKVDPTTRWN